MDENPPPPQKKESLLDRVRLKLPQAGSFVQTFLIPGSVIVLILLVGGGGTYLVASNVFNQPGSSSNVGRISESDIPSLDSINTSTPTPRPPSPTPELIVEENVTPTPTSSPAASWTPYNFSSVNLNFKYPPGWYVNVGATSGSPYVTLQNYAGVTPSSTTNHYSVFIGRLDQVGITTISGLTTQLALSAASNVYINGKNMGQTTVISSTPTTINRYNALERMVTYSSDPTTQVYELYVLDGVTNVIKFVPQLDTSYGQPYFDILLTSVDFTN